MQAALMLRSKQRFERRRKLKKLGRLLDLPPNVSVKEIPPYPQYPPKSWVNIFTETTKITKNGLLSTLYFFQEIVELIFNTITKIFLFDVFININIITDI